MSNKPKVAYLSNHFSGQVKLHYLLREQFPIDTIVTLTPQLAEIYHVAGYVDFQIEAARFDIPIRQAQSFNLKSESDLSFFEKQAFDVLLISGWQRIVPANILNTLSIGAIAEHGSAEYLPRGRGRSPINWSIIEGKKRFVLHIFKATPDVDAGPIIDYDTFQITPFDNIKTVYYKAAICSAQLLQKNWEAIVTGRVQYKCPASTEPTFFRKRTEKDDFIDWTQSTESIHNHIRAITSPYPQAKTKLNGKIFYIQQAIPFDNSLDCFEAPIASILFQFPVGSLLVKTTDGTLLIQSYQYDGQPELGQTFE